MKNISLTVLDIVVLSSLIVMIVLGYAWHCAEVKTEELYAEAEDNLYGTDLYLLTIFKQLGKVVAYAIVILLVY